MSKSILGRFLINILCIIVLSTLTYLTNTGNFYPSQTIKGFFCVDESLRYPYTSNTVSSLAILVPTILVPLLLFIIVETSTVCYLRNRHPNILPFPTKIFNKEIPLWLWNIMVISSIYFFGYFTCAYITILGKLLIGQLRPHFIAVCQPEIDFSNCTHEYIKKYTCEGPANLVLEARRSFPSGHASMSMYSYLFIAIYFHFRFIWNIGTILKMFLQSFLIMVVFYIGLTRISDYKHHWGDVLAGFILGIVIVIFMWYLFFKFSSAIIKTSQVIIILDDERDVDSVIKRGKAYDEGSIITVEKVKDTISRKTAGSLRSSTKDGKDTVSDKTAGSARSNRSPHSKQKETNHILTANGPQH